MPSEIKEILEREFFEIVPFNVAVIDRKYNIVSANNNFAEYFGKWQGKKCYEVYKKLRKPCQHCRVGDVFDTREVRVSDESGVDRHGRPCHYVVHLAPIVGPDGKSDYVIEMSTDVTETSHWQREYNILFERVPCYISVIDRNYKIIRANEKFRQTFGDVRGKYCYEVYKKKKHICKNCPATKTFHDGLDHTSTQIGITSSGEKAHYIVSTTPLSRGSEGPSLAIEIATDITEINQLQDQLYQAHDFYATLIENAKDGIVALDANNKTQIFNPAAREILDWPHPRKPGLKNIQEMLPEEFFDSSDKNDIIYYSPECTVYTSSNQEVPVRFNSIELHSKKKTLGRVAFMQDLREIKQLEKEKLDAERLGAVGQTVAGLAHTIKNLLMGLEGGIYIVDTGLRSGDVSRIVEGWDILQRNFYKTTDLVKDFLSFAKGRLPELKLNDPNSIIKDIIDLYHDAAKKQNVELIADPGKEVKPALLDREGIEACLTNLVSNAIDAAVLGENKTGRVVMRTREKGASLVFEVEDNGTGMDSEVIQKVFTSFFTTKGNKGTGLGLLTTHKIVKEHGGSINVESDLGRGSVFTIDLPRKRLEMIAKEARKDKINKKGKQ
ncbi:MAG: PAS domain-containing protein [Candidatus Kapaibacterium sp.]